MADGVIDKAGDSTCTKEDVGKKPFVVRTAVEIQKRQLEKLMKDPDKPVVIPEPRKAWKPSDPREFNRNVMGSSAGAGSGEFHVYRATRRREYTRQQYIEEQAQRSDLDNIYHKKLEENKTKAEEMTAKKRAKRQKKKQKRLQKKKRKELSSNDQNASKNGSGEESGKESGKEEEEEEEEEVEPHFVIGGR